MLFYLFMLGLYLFNVFQRIFRKSAPVGAEGVIVPEGIVNARFSFSFSLECGFLACFS